MMMRMTREQYEAIVSYAREKAPVEACGLLGGIAADGEKMVKKVYFLTNIDDSPAHFSLSPEEQFAAVRDMRASGWTLLANFLSQPASPSRTSEEDKRLAFDAKLSCLILSLAEETPVLNSFLIDREKNVTQEHIEIESETTNGGNEYDGG